MSHTLTDDSNPIKIGDTTMFAANSPQVVIMQNPAAPQVTISHRCFHQTIGGLAIQNKKEKAIAITDGIQTIALNSPWALILNDETTIASEDNLTIRILHITDYDMSSVPDPYEPTNKTVNVLYIGSKKLQKAKLVVLGLPPKEYDLNPAQLVISFM